MHPDAAYVGPERLETLPRGALRSFPPVCPDFVIELLSESDSPANAAEKMRDWIANGAQLGWLIDPYARQVTVYRPGQAPESVRALEIAGDSPVEGFVLDLARV